MTELPHTESSSAVGCMVRLCAMILALFVCLILSLCLSSCRAGKTITEYVEKPVIVTQEHHTESVKIDIVRDTIKQRDSIYHYIKGDTTIIERWHYYTNNNNAIRVDTLIKVDSVQVPVVTEKITTQVQEVEKPLKWHQKLLMVLGGLSVIAGGLLAAYKLGRRKLISK